MQRITSTFCTGPAEYSSKYIHFPEIVFARVCRGISSIRLLHAGDNRFSLPRLGNILYFDMFTRGLKNFSCAKPDLVNSMASSITACFVMIT